MLRKSTLVLLEGRLTDTGKQSPRWGMAQMTCALHTFLQGITVVDLSHYIAGPYASLTLADMGATVLHIEPPGGDPMRALGPRDAKGTPVFHGALNAGKTVLRLDLKDPEDHARLLALIDTADVFIEGFRAGVMQRLHLDYDRLRRRRPSLIYCSLSGYGADGPLHTKAGHDGNFLAERGLMDRNGRESPMYFDPPIADMAGALYATTAILGALIGRMKTGQGLHIDLALADTLMPLQLPQLAGWQATGITPTRRSSYLNGGTAYYNVYATQDHRHVMLGAVEAKFWRNFCLAADLPDCIERQQEPTPQDRLTDDIADFFATLPLEEILTRFDGMAPSPRPVLVEQP